MRQLRLFTAIMPALPERRAVDALRRGWLAGAGRVRPGAERLHMTLQFVAHWPAARLEEWQQALRGLRFAPFDIELDRCERWRGDLLVLRPRGSAQLLALHAATDRIAHEVGVPVDARRWRPHVTTLRDAPAAVPTPVPAPLRWHVAAVCLVCSDTAARPPRYDVVGRYPAHAPRPLE